MVVVVVVAAVVVVVMLLVVVAVVAVVESMGAVEKAYISIQISQHVRHWPATDVHSVAIEGIPRWCQSSCRRPVGESGGLAGCAALSGLIRSDRLTGGDG